MRPIRAISFALLMVSVLAAPALAQNPAVELEVAAGYGGRHLPGVWVPVSVVVESSRALRAVLEVVSVNLDQSTQVSALNIEVPAGGRKEFNLVVPSPTSGNSLEALVRADRRVLARRGTALIHTPNTTLVGMMGLEAPEVLRNGSLKTLPVENEIRPVEVPEDFVALGRRALEPLAYVVGDASEIGRLSDAHRNSLFDWVVTGGRLLVFVETPEALEWAPGRPKVELGTEPSGLSGGDAQLRGRSGVIFDMGAGELVVARGPVQRWARDSEFWQAAIRPAPLGHIEGQEPFAMGLGRSGEFELANELTRDRSNTVRLRWFVAFLVAYVALVGPVNYIVLKRMGRRELAWVTIPAISILFTAVAFAVTSGTRGGLAIRQTGTVLAAREGEAAQRIVTVSAGSSGERSVGFGTYDATVPWDFRGRARRLVTQVAAGESRAVISNAPFSLGIARGGLEEFPGYIDAEVTWDGNEYEASVTNRTPVRLSEVSILEGDTAGGAVGDLAPGATEKLTFKKNDPAFGPPLAEMIWNQNQDDFALKQMLLGQLRELVRNKGAVEVPLAIGIAKDLRPAITVNGKVERPDGMLLVASPVRMRVTPNLTGTVDRALVRNDLVLLEGGQGVGAEWRNDPRMISVPGTVRGAGSSRLPRGADPQKVERAVVRGVVGGSGVLVLEMYDWSARQWTLQKAAGRFELNFPASVVSTGGEMYLRFGPEREPTGFAFGTEVVLR